MEYVFLEKAETFRRCDMEQIDKKWARKVLDNELLWAFELNKWQAASALLRYAMAIEVISHDEYKYMKKAIECLIESGGEKKCLKI